MDEGFEKFIRLARRRRLEKKRCPKCGEVKPVDMFHKSAAVKDGLASWCKECRKEYQERPEVKARNREWWKEYRQGPEFKEWSREYRKKCYQTPEGKERIRENQKKYYQTPEVKERVRPNRKGLRCQDEI